MNKKKFEFKSEEPFYTKEKLGIKNNTVRLIKLEDERYWDLAYWESRGFADEKLIITISLTPNKLHQLKPNETESFTRRIKDISIWHNLIIITWFENNEEHKIEVKK